MFNQLAKLLQSGDTIMATIALIEPGRFRLTVHPKLSGASADAGKILSKPFAIEGTADELDVELPVNLGGFATSVNSAREVFAGLDAELKAATDKAAADAKAATKPAPKPTPAPAKKQEPAKPVAKPAAKPAPAKPAAKAAPILSEKAVLSEKTATAPVAPAAPAEPVTPPAELPPIEDPNLLL